MEQEGLASLVTTPLGMNLCLVWWLSCGEQESLRLPAAGGKLPITFRGQGLRRITAEQKGGESPRCSNCRIPVDLRCQNIVHCSGVSHPPATAPVKAEPSARAEQRGRAAKNTRNPCFFFLLLGSKRQKPVKNQHQEGHQVPIHWVLRKNKRGVIIIHFRFAFLELLGFVSGSAAQNLHLNMKGCVASKA